jgi:hypothetical protein
MKEKGKKQLKINKLQNIKKTTTTQRAFPDNSESQGSAALHYPFIT